VPIYAICRASVKTFNATFNAKKPNQVVRT
jgi:hypothetical protein